MSTVVPLPHNVPSTKIFGREPAVIIAFIAGTLNFLLSILLPWSTQQVSLVVAAVSAVGAVVIAIFTKDSLLAVGLGAIQALLAVAVGFGMHISTDQQAAVMAFMNVAFGLFNRQNTTPDPTPSLNLSGTSYPVAPVVPITQGVPAAQPAMSGGPAETGTDQSQTPPATTV